VAADPTPSPASNGEVDSDRATTPGGGSLPAGLSTENGLLRLGLFCGAITGFSAGSRVAAVGEVTASGVSMGLMLLLWLLCFGMLIAAAHRRPHAAARALIPVTLAVTFVAFVHVHGLHSRMYGPGTTDLVVFQDYAARLLLQGDNPYAYDLRPAFELHGAPLTYSTPLLDGDYTGRLAYPALSTLLFVPFLLVGVSSSWVYPCLFVVGMVVLWRACPKPLRPLILLPWFFEQRYVLAALGGVSDIVWAALLVLVVATWNRRFQRGVWYGLACAFKQSVWPLAPFFLVRLWHETPGSRGDKLREMVLFGGISTLVFMVVNGPFILAGPAIWWAGVMEPVTADMITLGYGLSSLTMAGWVVVAKGSYGLFVMLSLLLCLVVYFRHFSVLTAFMWVAPGIVLWFGNRSLTSYWYYFVLPLALELARAHWARPPRAPAVSWWPTAGLVGAFMALVGVTIAVAGASEPDVGVSVGPRIYTNGDRADYLFVTVRNRSDQTLEPRFAVQTAAEQPFFWTIVRGPVELLPGAKADYEIKTGIWYEQFDLRKGGLLTVAGRDDYSRRTSVWMPPMEGHAHRGQVVNGDFRFWLSDPLAPVRWSPILRPAEGGRIHAAVESPQEGALDFSLISSTTETHNLARLVTRIDLPHSPLRFRVRVPETANLLPNLDVLYGVDFVTDRARIMVLFGDEQRFGWMDFEGGQVPYWMIPTPRRAWTDVEVDPRVLFENMDADILPVRHREHAFTGVDYPMTPLEVRLTLASRGGGDTTSGQFGPVENTALPGPPDLGTPLLDRPERWAMWIGDYNLEAGNPQKAHDAYDEVLAQVPDFVPAVLQSAEADMQMGRLTESLAGYEHAASLEFEVGRAQLGRGLTLLALGKTEEALSAFETAISELDIDDLRSRAGAHRGAAVAHLATGDCAQARRAMHAAWELDPALSLPTAELESCERAANP
jgi:uncharacterized membrane protein